MDDFRKYATKHLGMNGMVLDDVIKSQAGYLNLILSAYEIAFSYSPKVR